jgi:FeS assembly SUF system protein
MSSQPNNDQPRVVPLADAPAFDTSALTRPSTTESDASTGKPPSPPFVADPIKTLTLKPPIVDAISKVFDPEIPVNIYELGLIYDIEVDADANVLIRMTLTAPGCPSAQSIPVEVQSRVRQVETVQDVKVDVVWDPPWTRDRMSDTAKLALGLF